MAPTLPNGTSLVGKGHGGKHAGGPSRPTVQPIQALADAAVASGSAPPGGRAAYVFALFGACDDLHRANLLAALGVLARTKPRHAVRVMLDGACRDDAALSRQIVARGAAPLPLAPAPSARCRGIKYAPGSLKHGKGAGYFDATYTKLRVWNLTAYDVALSLDSDVAVLQNLDHVLDGFLAARREVREVRTPQGCLAEGAVSPFLNTGVWAVRPSAPLYARLEAFLERGTVKCGVGDQTAAMSFFGGNRARERIASLHAGYNLKADSGVERCLLQVAHLRRRRPHCALVGTEEAARPRRLLARRADPRRHRAPRARPLPHRILPLGARADAAARLPRAHTRRHGRAQVRARPRTAALFAAPQRVGAGGRAGCCPSRQDRAVAGRRE